MSDVRDAIDRIVQGEVLRDERGFEPCPWHRRQYPHVLVKNMGEGRTKTYQLIARCDMCFAQRAVLVPPGVVRLADGHNEVIIVKLHKELQEAWNWTNKR